jgi:MOSC domain-containing protein YiiM
MELISINVGLPREVSWQGKTVSTAIFKSPVEGPIKLRTLNLEGDGQADLSVHGGPNKAAYIYPAEHYVFWRGELPDMELTWGHFGENFTTQGLLEENVQIGDTFRVGSALVKVTEPRMPCYKLGIRFGRVDMVKRFLASRRTGFYLTVLEEGTVQAGDTFAYVERSTHGIGVVDITRLYAFDKDDWATMRRVVEVEALPESWRGYFQQRLKKRDQGST